MTFIFDNFMPGVADSVVAGVGGGPAMLIQQNNVYNASTGNTTQNATTDTPITISPPSDFSIYERRDSSVLAGDVKIFVSPLVASGSNQGQQIPEPLPGSVIDLGSGNPKFVVVRILGKNMSGLNSCGYFLQCRANK